MVVKGLVVKGLVVIKGSVIKESVIKESVIKGSSGTRFAGDSIDIERRKVNFWHKQS